MVLYLAEDIIKEAVSGQEVINALDHRNAVLINYADENASHTGKRYIEPYVYGTTTAGNPCIRAYQYWGDTKRGVPKWKMFRLDRITSWEPTKDTFELEPQARGWAAQAYNQLDKSMSEVFKTVDLGDTDNQEITGLDRLRARTRQLQNGPRLNIKDINMGSNKQQAPEKPEPNQAGPIINQQPAQQNIQHPQQQPVEQEPTQQPTENSPIQPEPVQSGPITGNTINPEENKPEDLMSNDDFKNMLKRNLEITQKEKERRKQRNNLKNQQ